MKTTVSVDGVGRLVLPQRVREAIGVLGPTSVTLEVIEDTVRISVPERPTKPLIRRRGRRVYGGSLPDDWDSGEAVSLMRSQRLRR